MNIFFLSIAAAIFIMGTIVGNKALLEEKKQKDISKPPVSKQVLSEEDSNKDADTEIENDDKEKESPTPTMKPFPTLVTISPSKLQPTTAPVVQAFLDSYIYPGSSVKEKTSNKLVMESGADPKNIFEWYKSKVKELHLSVNTSVFTQANDKYQIKVVGSDGKTEVSIEGNKEGDGLMVITVTIK